MVTHTESSPIADYGIIGDLHSCALISKAGSIDWCCLPRFDSASIFGRILDWDKGGYFLVAPTGVRSVERRYIPGTNVLETTFVTDTGTAILTDFMPIREHAHEMGPREQAPEQQIVRLCQEPGAPSTQEQQEENQQDSCAERAAGGNWYVEDL